MARSRSAGSATANLSYEHAQQELLNALSALHIGGKYSDLTVRCQHRQWAVHRAIVCSRSAFFDSACDSRFREAGTGVIDLSEDDLEAVEQMIYFFYHLDYTGSIPHVPSTGQRTGLFRHRVAADARRKTRKRIDLSLIEDPLLAQAEHFNQPARPPTPPPSSPDVDQQPGPRLHKRSPSHKLSRPQTPESLDSVEELANDDGPQQTDEEEDESELDDEQQGQYHHHLHQQQQQKSQLLLHTRVYALAEKYDIAALKDVAQHKFEMDMACFYDSPDFAQAIEEVYCSTIDSDRGLRDVVLRAFRTHPQLACTQDVYAVIRDTPSLALELFKLERGIQ